MDDPIKMKQTPEIFDDEFIVVTIIAETEEEIHRESVEINGRQALESKIAELSQYRIRQEKMFKAGAIPYIKEKRLIINPKN